MKKIILILLIFPFLSIAQTNKYKKEIEYYKPTHKKKEQRIYREGKLTEWTGWYENGRYKFFKHYKNQKKDGIFKEFYEDGNVKLIEKYHYDSIVDTASYFYVNGKLENQKIYKGGDQIVDMHWLNNGLKDFEERFDRDKNIKVKVTYEFYRNNNVKTEEVYTNNVISKRVSYYENGKKKSENFYDNGRLEGDAIEYYEDGKIKSKITYDNGTAKKIENWNENGQRENIRVVTDQKPDSLKVKPKPKQ